MFKKICIILCSFIFISTAIGLGALFYLTHQPWVDFSVLEFYKPGKPSILLDDVGNEWARFSIDRREFVTLDHVPAQLINAFMAAEDRQFFQHSGLSFRGIVRSILVNIYAGRRAQGASTITQQLVRLLFFDTAKSFSRKIKEQILALAVEQHFTKEHILEAYLNHTYFGAGIYGVEAASQRFWDKHVQDITIDQAAVLASIVQSPGRYCPLYHPEATKKRRDLILHKMADLGFITADQLNNTLVLPVIITKPVISTHGCHLKETIRIFLEKLVGKQKLYTGGLTIQTTINIQAQEIAERVFTQHLEKFRLNIYPDIEGALISIDIKSGAVKALIGGYDFGASQFNRAFKAQRQMGSTFKPLIYAAALTKGRKFTDIEIDEPISIPSGGQEWAPQNAYKTFEGPMTLARALSLSTNTITIKLLMSLGIQPVLNLAKICGLKNIPPAYPSVALGCLDNSLIQTAGMINIFANNGVYVKPYYISWIKDMWGKKVWKHTPIERTIFSTRISNQVTQVLSIRPARLRKQQPKSWPICDVFGKTGTTNDARTCWFVGATPDFTTAVYIGRDDNKPLGQTTYASQTALPIWREFNRLLNKEPQRFEYHPSLKLTHINGITGEPAAPNQSGAIEVLL